MLKNFFNRLFPPKPKLSSDIESWKEKGQMGEFGFHLKNEWRQSDDFMEQSIRLFEHFGLKKEEFAGKTVIDLGAGSKLRSLYFSESRVIAIEPLADKFRKEIEWCDLDDADKVYSTPAELCIDECVNSADLLVSINVLDHCYNFEQIIENIYKYLKLGGTAFLSFDIHYRTDELHPLILTESIVEEVFTRIGFSIENYSKGLGDIIKGGAQTYGYTEYCVNYWLKKTL